MLLTLSSCIKLVQVASRLTGQLALARSLDPVELLDKKGCGRSNCSDGFVGVQHDAEGAAAHGTGRKVLGELGTDETVVAVAGDDFAPDGLVAGFVLGVLRFVDVGDALSVVESGGLALVASVDLEDGLLFNLGSLTTLKVHEGGLLVKSATQNQSDKNTHLTGWVLCAALFFSISFPIFMLCNNDKTTVF